MGPQFLQRLLLSSSASVLLLSPHISFLKSSVCKQMRHYVFRWHCPYFGEEAFFLVLWKKYFAVAPSSFSILRTIKLSVLRRILMHIYEFGRSKKKMAEASTSFLAGRPPLFWRLRLLLQPPQKQPDEEPLFLPFILLCVELCFCLQCVLTTEKSCRIQEHWSTNIFNF